MSVSRKIIVGSRRSNLALTQTKWVINQLEALGLPYQFEIKEIVTKGDRILDVMLSKVGGKGLFVKEIEQALYDKEIDFAVHSIKDMPAQLPEGLTIACIPMRVDPRDVLIAKEYQSLAELPAGSIVGTSSLRRSSQLLHLRPDLEIKWIRGNIDTRLRKLREEDYDAIILAAAGLERVGWSRDKVTEYLPVEVCLPAVGQGALGIECREDDQELLDLLAKLHDQKSGLCVQAERSFLAKIEGGCQVPVAAHAIYEDGQLQLTGMVGSADGKNILKESMVGDDPLTLGEQLAERLFERGAGEILSEVRQELDQ